MAYCAAVRDAVAAAALPPRVPAKRVAAPMGRPFRRRRPRQARRYRCRRRRRHRHHLRRRLRRSLFRCLRQGRRRAPDSLLSPHWVRFFFPEHDSSRHGVGGWVGVGVGGGVVGVGGRVAWTIGRGLGFRTLSHAFARFRTLSHAFARFRTLSHANARRTLSSLPWALPLHSAGSAEAMGRRWRCPR